MMTTMETRMSKWAEKRAEIEREAKEIADALKNENAVVFDEMMGEPMKALEEILHAFD